MRAEARFIGVATALLWAVSGGAIAEQPNPSGLSEHIIWTLSASQSKGGWKFGYEHVTPHQYLIEELIRKDDNIDNWRELVTTENFLRRQGMTAEDFFNSMKLAREKHCPAAMTQWMVIDKSAVSLVYETIRTQPCDGFAPERELGRILFGKFNCFRLRYDAKGTAWEPGQREEWLKSISEAKVVTY